MVTWIVGLIVVGAVYLAAKQVLRAHKNGGCIGCSESGKGGCCHCTDIKTPKIGKKPKCCEK